MGLKLMCAWERINVRISETFLEDRNSFCKPLGIDHAVQLDYIKANLYICTHSFHSRFQFRKRHHDQRVSQDSCAQQMR